MQLTVKVAPLVAAALRANTQSAGNPPAGIADVQQATQELGLELTPMHPDIDDPELSTWFTVQVPSGQSLNEVQNRLLRATGVEGAFESGSPEPAGE